MYTGLYHTHASSWVILVILFVLSFFLTKNKVLPMILRLFYLIMIVTGGIMLFGQGGYDGAFHLKALLAIILIGMMEMVLARRKKGKNALPFLIVLIVLLVVVVLIGYDVITFGG
jgi:peptidoglycan/LPS O-acetylase OafA/YrhL